MFKRTIFFIFFYLPGYLFFSQTKTAPILAFDFNDQQFKESNNKVIIKPVGVTLTEDRFGNKRSAVYFHGNATSYINLGTSNLLKSSLATLSMWVNIQDAVLAGKGYDANPLILIRNNPAEDFNIGFGIGYNPKVKRLGTQASKDSLQEVVLFDKDTVSINTWYHLVVTFDDHFFAFYINGDQEGKTIKNFKSTFLDGDSVLLGRTLGTKNQRFTHAILDDIRFYDRVLSEDEIKALYNEPNPNRFTNVLTEILKYGIIIIVLVGIIILILIRNKRNFKKQKEYYELNNKIQELEIKVIKTRMNPHFVSNCLAAIQNLIYTGEIDKAGEYLAQFSFFLRQVLELSDKTYTTLEEELSLIKLNVELEQLRFKNDFSFKLEIDEGIPLREILIPSLISQPFIENAIWHGLLPLKERPPRLTIKISTKKPLLYLSIEDNGVGRDFSEISGDRKPRGTKLATDKIDSINRLRNSSDYKLEIIDLLDTNNLSAGTKIIIQLSQYTLDE